MIKTVVIWLQIIVPFFHQDPCTPKCTPGLSSNFSAIVCTLLAAWNAFQMDKSSQSSPCPSASISATLSMRYFPCLLNGSLPFHNTFGRFSLHRLPILIPLVMHCFIHGCSNRCQLELKRDLIHVIHAKFFCRLQSPLVLFLRLFLIFERSTEMLFLALNHTDSFLFQLRL